MFMYIFNLTQWWKTIGDPQHRNAIKPRLHDIVFFAAIYVPLHKKRLFPIGHLISNEQFPPGTIMINLFSGQFFLYQDNFVDAYIFWVFQIIVDLYQNFKRP